MNPVRPLLSVIVVACLLGAAAPAAADSVEAAYQFLHLRALGNGTSLPLGASVGYDYQVGTSFGVGGFFDWSQTEDSERDVSTTTTIARYGVFARFLLLDNPRRNVYLQASVGRHRTHGVVVEAGQTTLDSAATVGFAALGGGYVHRINGRVSALAQADYLNVSDQFYRRRGLRALLGVRIRVTGP